MYLKRHLDVKARVTGAAVLVAVTLAVTAVLIPQSARANEAAESAADSPGRCSLPLRSGVNRIPLVSGGIARPFELYVPKAYDGHTRIPVVIDGHGSTSNGLEHFAVSGMPAIAEEEGFAVAAPTAAVPFPDRPGGYIWNFPGVPLFGSNQPAPPGTPDDDLMVLDMIAQVKRVLCTDSRRVYATGFSAGGRMASRLACEHADTVAAIGAVSGLRAGSEPDVTDCHPSRPVPIITFHGTADPIWSFQDTPSRYGIPEAVSQWADIDRCHQPPRVTAVTPTVDLQSYAHCAKGSEIAFYTLKGAGHRWPGSSFPLSDSQFGPADNSIDATRLTWEFFSRHALPASCVVHAGCPPHGNGAPSATRP